MRHAHPRLARTVPILLGLAAIAAGAQEAPRTLPVARDADLDGVYAAYRPLLARELATREPDDPADLYKFLYQALMGPAHAGVGEVEALAWLEEEWAGMAAEPLPAPGTWPLWEPLRPDGALGRLHLQPLRDLVTAGVPAAQRPAVEAAARERLAVVFARTAARWEQERGLLRLLWARVAADAPLWSARLAPEAMAELGRELAAAGWPAVHHGDGYRERWRPHYRVVARDLLPPAWRRGAEGAAP